ncbi:pentapeptide repeat-containing protein [Candidatus Fokinia crypta]|uniref:Pentapeptide repeat-containing protein n=1 Tax=Candidatus Fokinia crypta TaxID=1920990 RepID=A0ABZ0UPC5_9RICK|nr:pentapeptide repeat-containing protein [Candidatus Fokinia cryptica]WPX97976.1 Pentapeptide repeat-containing protein [Candidatus Fokinia cryptica]
MKKGQLTYIGSDLEKTNVKVTEEWLEENLSKRMRFRNAVIEDFKSNEKRELRDYEFINTEIKNSDFSQFSLIGLEFGNTTFINSKFIGNDLSTENCNFQDSTINEVSFENCKGTDVNFLKSKLSDVILKKCQFEQFNASKAVLDNLKVVETTLSKSNFSTVTGKEINLEKCNLEDSVFQSAKLLKFTATDSELKGVNFNKIDCDDFVLKSATLKNLENANFQDAKVKDARIMNYELSNLSFQNLSASSIKIENSLKEQECKCLNMNFDKSKIDTLEFQNCTLNGTAFKEANIKNLKIGSINESLVDCKKIKIDNSSIQNLEFQNCALDELHIKGTEQLMHIENFSVVGGNKKMTFSEAKLEKVAIQNMQVSDCDMNSAIFDQVKIENFQAVQKKEEIIPDLSKLKFNDTTFNSCNIENCKLTESVFTNVEVGELNIKSNIKDQFLEGKEIKFEKALLRNMTLDKCDLSSSSFSKTTIKNPIWTNSKLENSTFNDVTIEGGKFTEVSFSNASFKGKTKFKDIVFTNCDLSNCDLEALEFENVTFENCKMPNAKLSDGKYQNVKFKKCNLEGADCSKTHFFYSQIEDCSLTRTSFKDSEVVLARGKFFFTNHDIKDYKDVYGSQLKLKEHKDFHEGSPIKWMVATDLLLAKQNELIGVKRQQIVDLSSILKADITDIYGKSYFGEKSFEANSQEFEFALMAKSLEISGNSKKTEKEKEILEKIEKYRELSKELSFLEADLWTPQSTLRQGDKWEKCDILSRIETDTVYENVVFYDLPPTTIKNCTFKNCIFLGDNTFTGDIGTATFIDCKTIMTFDAKHSIENKLWNDAREEIFKQYAADKRFVGFGVIKQGTLLKEFEEWIPKKGEKRVQKGVVKDDSNVGDSQFFGIKNFVSIEMKERIEELYKKKLDILSHKKHSIQMKECNGRSIVMKDSVLAFKAENSDIEAMDITSCTLPNSEFNALIVSKKLRIHDSDIKGSQFDKCYLKQLKMKDTNFDLGNLEKDTIIEKIHFEKVRLNAAVVESVVVNDEDIAIEYIGTPLIVSDSLEKGQIKLQNEILSKKVLLDKKIQENIISKEDSAEINVNIKELNDKQDKIKKDIAEQNKVRGILKEQSEYREDFRLRATTLSQKLKKLEDELLTHDYGALAQTLAVQKENFEEMKDDSGSSREKFQKLLTAVVGIKELKVEEAKKELQKTRDTLNSLKIANKSHLKDRREHPDYQIIKDLSEKQLELEKKLILLEKLQRSKEKLQDKLEEEVNKSTIAWLYKAGSVAKSAFRAATVGNFMNNLSTTGVAPLITATTEGLNSVGLPVKNAVVIGSTLFKSAKEYKKYQDTLDIREKELITTATLNEFATNFTKSIFSIIWAYLAPSVALSTSSMMLDDFEGQLKYNENLKNTYSSLAKGDSINTKKLFDSSIKRIAAKTLALCGVLTATAIVAPMPLVGAVLFTNSFFSFYGIADVAVGAAVKLFKKKEKSTEEVKKLEDTAITDSIKMEKGDSVAEGKVDSLIVESKRSEVEEEKAILASTTGEIVKEPVLPIKESRTQYEMYGYSQKIQKVQNERKIFLDLLKKRDSLENAATEKNEILRIAMMRLEEAKEVVAVLEEREKKDIQDMEFAKSKADNAILSVIENLTSSQKDAIQSFRNAIKDGSGYETLKQIWNDSVRNQLDTKRHDKGVVEYIKHSSEFLEIAKRAALYKPILKANEKILDDNSKIITSLLEKERDIDTIKGIENEISKLRGILALNNQEEITGDTLEKIENEINSKKSEITQKFKKLSENTEISDLSYKITKLQEEIATFNNKTYVDRYKKTQILEMQQWLQRNEKLVKDIKPAENSKIIKDLYLVQNLKKIKKMQGELSKSEINTIKEAKAVLAVAEKIQELEEKLENFKEQLILLENSEKEVKEPLNTKFVAISNCAERLFKLLEKLPTDKKERKIAFDKLRNSITLEERAEVKNLELIYEASLKELDAEKQERKLILDFKCATDDSLVKVIESDEYSNLKKKLYEQIKSKEVRDKSNTMVINAPISKRAKSILGRIIPSDRSFLSRISSINRTKGKDGKFL